MHFSVWISSLMAIVMSVGLSNSDRVAPGVPPQHYNDLNYQQQQGYAQGHGHGHPPPPPPPQQYHHQQQQQATIQQQQQQQVPFQQQQVPFQQQPPQPGHGHGGHVQQPPPPHGHAPQHPGTAGHHGHHGGPGGPGNVLDTTNIGQERQHIQDHMSVPIDTSKMTEQELQFHYFKMHDADNNNKLDGCELVKSLIHWHDEANHDPKSGHPIPDAKVFTDDELRNMIDPILQKDDKNKDGFIDYGEFIQAQAAASSRVAEHAA